MKKILILIWALVLFAGFAGAAEPTWYPRMVSAPETELQQAVYDFALEQAEIMKRNLARVSENMRLEKEYGSLSDELFAFLQAPDTTFAEPVNVVVMTPTASFGEGGAVQQDFADTPDDFDEELWSSAGMRTAHYANLFNGDSRQTEYLDSLAIHSARNFPAGRGMAHALVIYGEGLPQIGISILLDESGPAACQAEIIYFDQIVEYPTTFLGNAINYWGDAAFETVYIK